VLRLKNTPLILFTLLLSLTTACQTQTTPATTSDTRAADENAIRTADIEWSKAASTKDVEKTIAFYSDDAIVMPPNSPQATGKEAIRGIWKGLLGAPGFSGGWKPAKVEVAKSSDIAYVTGTYEFTENDASGKPMTDKGKYVEVWKKQADGSWKCAVDIFNSDIAAPSTTESKSSSTKSK
jgi:ketosteroid isomerase-like protein